MAAGSMRPLDGIRILDLSRLLPGPFGTLVLADLGAQVDKIEDPGAGDYLRHVPPQRGGSSVSFQAINRGKRSGIIDLKKPAGRDAFKRLVRHYDVLFEQFRPGVLARLGLSHDLLLEQNRRLIICALTGYGQAGKLADRAGHDLNYLARAGLLAAQGPLAGPPQVPGFQLADISGGMWCVIAILAALRRRDAGGEGGLCDIAMTDGVLGFASYTLPAALSGVTPARGDDVLTGGIAPYNTYLSQDGWPVTLGALEPKFWSAFCAATGLEPDMTALFPGDHQPALRERVGQIFASKTKDEWTAFSEQHDCCVAVALGAGELAHDEHLQSRGLLFDLPAGDERTPQFRTPVTPPDRQLEPAPRAGQHSRAILAEAGFDEGEIAALIAAGAVVQADD